jgi:hypothetical protein
MAVMHVAFGIITFEPKFAKIIFQSIRKCALYPIRNRMNPEKNSSDYKSRLTYGAIVGAILGMIIGTMPSNDPRVALLSMGVSAAVIGVLAVASNSFWESLRAAWELMRISFWRW